MVTADSPGSQQPPALQPEKVRIFPRWITWLVVGAVLGFMGWIYYFPADVRMYAERLKTGAPEAIRKPANPILLTSFHEKPAGWNGPPIALFAGGVEPHRWRVDLNSGQFVHTQTDFYIPDAIPINLTRVYRSKDTEVRDFGYGTTDSYAMYLLGDNKSWRYLEVNLPDGTIVHFPRTTPGANFDAVFQHDAAAGQTDDIFDHARLWWIGKAYELKMRDGTEIIFPASEFAQYVGQRAAIRISHPDGSTLDIKRDLNGNLAEIDSPNGAWLKFKHDQYNRITDVLDNHGRKMSYDYDELSCLIAVHDSSGSITRYGYDQGGRMLEILRPDGRIWLTNFYDTSRRVAAQKYLDGATASYKYTLDAESHIVATLVKRSDGSQDQYTFDIAGGLINHTQIANQ